MGVICGAQINFECIETQPPGNRTQGTEGRGYNTRTMHEVLAIGLLDWNTQKYNICLYTQHVYTQRGRVVQNLWVVRKYLKTHTWLERNIHATCSRRYSLFTN
jgi:hypothetical protein